MKLFYRMASILSVALLFLAPAPAAAQTQVETFNATGQYQITIPGTIVGPDIDFNGTLTLTSLSFTPGSVTFEGQPVDFSGTEASWLANTYDGQHTIPSIPGGIVNSSGFGATTGPAGTMNGDLNKNGLSLGPGFSDLNLDLQFPSTFGGVDQTFSWNSPLVPPLNGKTVEIRTSTDIIGVIPNFTFGAVAAVVDVVITGEIIAFEPVPTESVTWSAIKALYR